MVDKAQAADLKAADEATAPPASPVKRSMHRHTDPRDTVAEMAARAQEISQEAGSRIGKAMKDIISAAAGLAGFAVESARDLAQYMVRRGQMTQEEADKLIREAEEAYAKRARSTAAKPAAATTKDTPAARTAAPSTAKSAPEKKSAKSRTTKSVARPSAPKKKSAATAVPKKSQSKTTKSSKPAKKKK